MDRNGLDLIAAGDPRIESIWRALEAQAQPSYFLTWGWIENWLAALPAEERPSLAVISNGGEPAAAFFLAQRRVRRNFVLQSNALYFNATGSPRHDEVAIEHNGMLAAPGARRSLSGLLEMLPAEWDELYLPAIDRYAFDDLGAPTSPLATRYKVSLEREVSAPFVDLDAVRNVDGGYEALLHPSTRTQLHRARDIAGDVEIEIADDEDHAMDIWGELLRLHARRWASRGLRGAFASSWFEQFHRRLILSRLRHGELQLVRVSAAGKTLGCLYNLVSHGRVMFYQCGLASLDNPFAKAGYLCHAVAIEHNARAGHAIYDLVGGRARYKENLATGASRLVWVRVQRPLARFSIEENLRRWRDMLLGEPSPQPFVVEPLLDPKAA
jgi:CelD/BcsL family acetyltransferase involved in cellulose biosynthesis